MALKKFGNTLGKSSRITQEIKDITGNKRLEKLERKVKRKSNKEKFTEMKEGQEKNTVARRTSRLLGEKRKSEINETENSYKKKRFKGQNKEKWVVAEKCLNSSKVIKCDNERENKVKSSTIQNAQNTSRSENQRNSNQMTKDGNPKDNLKAQRSILQYFNVQ